MNEEIKVIDDFLANWKESAKEYYTKSYKRYIEIEEAGKDERDAFYKEYGGITNYWTLEAKEKYQQIMKPSRDFTKTITNSEYTILQNMKYGYKKLTDSVEILSVILDKQVEIKNKNLFNKVERQVGQITEAHLHIGVDGNINGTVNGEKGNAKVTTIYAGGYNIQCLHYRVLVK